MVLTSEHFRRMRLCMHVVADHMQAVREYLYKYHYFLCRLRYEQAYMCSMCGSWLLQFAMPAGVVEECCVVVCWSGKVSRVHRHSRVVLRFGTDSAYHGPLSWLRGAQPRQPGRGRHDMRVPR